MKRGFLPAALAAGLLSTTLAFGESLDASAAGRIEFQSFTPRTMFDLSRERRENWAAVKVWGDLSFPARMGDKVPAIVLSHGSGGVERNMSRWVEALNEIGVATFVVDTFGPRGVKRTAEDQALLSPAANLMDALQALQLLATHPRIDAARIGVMGFSRGGEVAFRSAIEPLLRAVVKSDLKFALHIPVYAGCNQVYWSDKVTRAPILNLVGAADDYTHAEPCEALAAKYAAAGTPIRTIKYPGAHHSWDATYPVFFLPGATSGYSCGVMRWDIDTWVITSERDGKVIPAGKVDEVFRSCVTRGAHVGRNEEAARASVRDVQAFVQSVFSRSSPPASRSP
ncbi:MAG: dienelactone hydrolase family protein [Usitatibacter sp.]